MEYPAGIRMRFLLRQVRNSCATGHSRRIGLGGWEKSGGRTYPKSSSLWRWSDALRLKWSYARFWAMRPRGVL